MPLCSVTSVNESVRRSPCLFTRSLRKSFPRGPSVPRHGKRSEEHTSELQSLAYLVCRLLLEKKNVKMVAPNVIFGEGPVWDKRTKALYFVDICGYTISTWKPRGKHEAILGPAMKANAMACEKDGRLVVAGWGGRTVFPIDVNGGSQQQLMTE